VSSWDDVREIALGLPETDEQPSRGHAFWRVRDERFVWERPSARPTGGRWGDRAPDGPILGVRVENLGNKEALISATPEVFFTTPHFDAYAAEHGLGLSEPLSPGGAATVREEWNPHTDIAWS